MVEQVEATRIIKEGIMVEVAEEPSSEEAMESEQVLRINMGTPPELSSGMAFEMRSIRA